MLARIQLAVSDSLAHLSVHRTSESQSVGSWAPSPHLKQNMLLHPDGAHRTSAHPDPARTIFVHPGDGHHRMRLLNSTYELSTYLLYLPKRVSSHSCPNMAGGSTHAHLCMGHVV